MIEVCTEKAAGDRRGPGLRGLPPELHALSAAAKPRGLQVSLTDPNVPQVPHQINASVEALICELHRSHPYWGTQDGGLPPWRERYRPMGDARPSIGCWFATSRKLARSIGFAGANVAANAPRR